jgi:hypothetical protein
MLCYYSLVTCVDRLFQCHFFSSYIYYLLIFIHLFTFFVIHLFFWCVCFKFNLTLYYQCPLCKCGNMELPKLQTILLSSKPLFKLVSFVYLFHLFTFFCLWHCMFVFFVLLFVYLWFICFGGCIFFFVYLSKFLCVCVFLVKIIFIYLLIWNYVFVCRNSIIFIV